MGALAVLTLVVIFWSSGRAGYLPSCTSDLCGLYEDFLWGDDKLTSIVGSTVLTYSSVVSRT